MTEQDIDTLIEFDRAWVTHIRQQWLRLMEIAVWGDLKSGNLGAAGKVRKRVLEIGERWRSIFNDRAWIPRARERAKNMLGSCLNLRDSLLLLEKAAKDLDGGADYGEFEQLLVEMHKSVVGPLAIRENQLAAALNDLNKSALEDEGAD